MSYRTLNNQQNLHEVWEKIEGVVSPNEASLMRSALLRFGGNRRFVQPGAI